MNHFFKILVFLLSTSVLANTANENQEIVQESKIEKYSKTIVEESRMNRDGKHFTVNLSLMGAQLGMIGATGINTGYFLTEDSLLTLSIASVDRIEILNSSIDSKAQAISIGYKYFTSNSFYIHTGLYSKSVNTKDDEYLDPITFDDKRVSYSTSHKGVFLKIGNQWQWSNFTLGCDWVGIGQDFSSDLSEADKIGENNPRMISAATLLNFYLGASF